MAKAALGTAGAWAKFTAWAEASPFSRQAAQHTHGTGQAPQVQRVIPGRKTEEQTSQKQMASEKA